MAKNEIDRIAYNNKLYRFKQQLANCDDSENDPDVESTKQKLNKIIENLLTQKNKEIIKKEKFDFPRRAEYG